MIREEKLSGDPERTGKSLEMKASVKTAKNEKQYCFHQEIILNMSFLKSNRQNR